LDKAKGSLIRGARPLTWGRYSKPFSKSDIRSQAQLRGHVTADFSPRQSATLRWRLTPPFGCATRGKNEEAWQSRHLRSLTPCYARLIANPAANWLYSSEPEENTSGRRIAVPRGKLLGGTSSINGQVFVRGQAQDFDTWAQLGNRGCSYA
jgi:hypothetical protein